MTRDAILCGLRDLIALGGALLLPRIASAAWGDGNWGEMIWGDGPPSPQVPSVETEGLVALALLVLLASRALVARRRRRSGARS